MPWPAATHASRPPARGRTRGRTPTGSRLPVQNIRSDTTGVARVRLSARGYWYIKFIHMVPVAGDSVNYESKWATLTFEAR